MVPGSGKYVTTCRAFTVAVGQERELLPADPARLALVLGAISGALTVVMLRIYDQGESHFLTRVTLSSDYQLLWKDVGPLVQGRMTLESQSGGTTIYVYELRYKE